MKSFTVSALIGLAAAMPELEVKFVNFIAKYSRNYQTFEEYRMRLEQFIINDILIEETNASQTSFVIGHNSLSDRTDEEYE